MIDSSMIQLAPSVCLSSVAPHRRRKHPEQPQVATDNPVHLPNCLNWRGKALHKAEGGPFKLKLMKKMLLLPA